LFDSVMALLQPCKISDGELQQDFLPTVRHLRLPGLNRARSLAEMVRELASLRDATVDDIIPSGLLQFLMRLQRRPPLREPITRWLEKNAASQSSDMETITQLLKQESQDKILLVEIAYGRESISGYELYVRTYDLQPLPGGKSQVRSVNNWDDFCAKLAADIGTLLQSYQLAEIHFLADPPLFDRPFHTIPLADGTALGLAAVVVVRHRARARPTRRYVTQSWNDYADSLRHLKASELSVVPVAVGGADLKREEKGLCCATFLVSGLATSGSALSMEKQTLQQLLAGGAPYICWLHTLPGPDGLNSITAEIRSWLKDCNWTLDQIPYIFTDKRSRNNPFAVGGTLLWDDSKPVLFPRV
jgi:hypothetical protein